MIKRVYDTFGRSMKYSLLSPPLLVFKSISKKFLFLLLVLPYGYNKQFLPLASRGSMVVGVRKTALNHPLIVFILYLDQRGGWLQRRTRTHLFFGQRRSYHSTSQVCDHFFISEDHPFPPVFCSFNVLLC